MTDALFPSGDGQTELSDDDKQGLIPTYIATQGELNEAEQRNIVEASLRPTPALGMLLDDAYLRKLHQRMFGNVWSWAGTYRLLQTNIGIASHKVPSAVSNLVRDVTEQIDQAQLSTDEIGARFHHQLVRIHPFPNGNGRFGRTAADYLMLALGDRAFSWGKDLDLETDELRARYLASLRAADSHNIDSLLEFVRS